MNERKYPIEASDDGRFIIEPWVYNDITSQVMGSQRDREVFQRDLKVKDEQIEQLKQENERLYKIISNLTSEK